MPKNPEQLVAEPPKRGRRRKTEAPKIETPRVEAPEDLKLELSDLAEPKEEVRPHTETPEDITEWEEKLAQVKRLYREEPQLPVEETPAGDSSKEGRYRLRKVNKESSVLERITGIIRKTGKKISEKFVEFFSYRPKPPKRPSNPETPPNLN